MTKLTDEQINKRIHELMGLCFHERGNKTEGYQCVKCSQFVFLSDLDFIYNFNVTWEGFGLLWTWLQKHERWEEFIEQYGYKNGGIILGNHISCTIISPSTLSKAVVEFFND